MMEKGHCFVGGFFFSVRRISLLSWHGERRRKSERSAGRNLKNLVWIRMSGELLPVIVAGGYDEGDRYNIVEV